MNSFASVVAVKGTGSVTAVDASGNTRVLHVGDALQQGETVRTSRVVLVKLLVADGSLLSIAPGQTVQLDAGMLEPDPQPASAPARKPPAAGVVAAPASAWRPWAVGTGATAAVVLLALLWRGLRKRQPLTESQRRVLATRLALLLEQQEDAHARR